MLGVTFKTKLMKYISERLQKSVSSRLPKEVSMSEKKQNVQKSNVCNP